MSDRGQTKPCGRVRDVVAQHDKVTCSMLDLFAEAAALTTLVFQRFNNKILCPKTSQDGIEVLEPFPELVELTERFIMEDSVLILIKWPYSIQDAPEGVHRFQNLIMRW